MNRRMTRRAAQGGFSLIELLVGLALLTLLAVAISGAFDGSRSRAQSLLSMMSELGSAQARLKNDTGCYVQHPSGLLSAPPAAADSFCNRTLDKTWNGPYVNRFELDAATNKQAIANRIADGVLVDFGKVVSNGRNVYYVTATNVPDDIAKQFLVECNGDDSAVNNFDGGKKCVGTNMGSNAAVVQLMFDSTR